MNPAWHVFCLAGRVTRKFQLQGSMERMRWYGGRMIHAKLLFECKIAVFLLVFVTAMAGKGECEHRPSDDGRSAHYQSDAKEKKTGASSRNCSPFSMKRRRSPPKRK